MATDHNPQARSRHENGPQMEEVGAEAKLQKPSDVDGAVHKGEDILAMQDLDPVLNAKMHLVNNVRWNMEPGADNMWLVHVFLAFN